MRYNSFHPGQVWLDTNGKRIHAHGGSILYENGRYYWYGENKEKTTGENGIWHWGIRCYVSDDLYNWEDLGLIIPPEPDDPASQAAAWIVRISFIMPARGSTSAGSRSCSPTARSAARFWLRISF